MQMIFTKQKLHPPERMKTKSTLETIPTYRVNNPERPPAGMLPIGNVHCSLTVVCYY